jgi:hypothetical protein
MARLTYEEKWAAVQCVTEDGRPIMDIVKSKKINNAPEYDSEALRKRSRETAQKRVVRYKRMAKQVAAL